MDRELLNDNVKDGNDAEINKLVEDTYDFLVSKYADFLHTEAYDNNAGGWNMSKLNAAFDQLLQQTPLWQRLDKLKDDEVDVATNKTKKELIDAMQQITFIDNPNDSHSDSDVLEAIKSYADELANLKNNVTDTRNFQNG